MSFSNGQLAIGRHKHALYINLEDPSTFINLKDNTLGKTEAAKFQIMKKKKTLLEETLGKITKKEEEDRKHEADDLSSLYDIFHKFKNVHKEILDPCDDQPRGYLCISEHMIDFKAALTVIPIAIKFPDHIINNSYFVENTLLQMKYQSDLTIWDMLIR